MTDRSDKTKEAIKHALIALMEREPFEVISVKQIVAASGVGRSTFYAYFEDKQDLLESIETSFWRTSPFIEADDRSRLPRTPSTTCASGIEHAMPGIERSGP